MVEDSTGLMVQRADSGESTCGAMRSRSTLGLSPPGYPQEVISMRLRVSWGLLAALAFLPGTVSAQLAIVQRNSNVYEAASTQSPLLVSLVEGDEVTLISNVKKSGYFHVRIADGRPGYIYGNRVVIVPLTVEDPPVAFEVGPPEIFRGCSPEGTAQQPSVRERNALKNRNRRPAPTDLNPLITLAAILDRGDDAARWEDADAAMVVGYVFHVKAGGSETVNCGETRSQWKDTHIELTLSANATDAEDRFVVEVTPRWRDFFHSQFDWSTSTLADELEGNCVRVTGWMFYDASHWHNAVNTNPNGTQIWRATAWEIHPVTALELVPCSS